MSKIRDIDLQPFALSRMHNLRFLKLYSSSWWKNSNKVHVSQGLESIFTELRYLRWEGCPLKSLQSNIQPEKLVKLEMPRSKVENLWSGVQQLANLKKIDLSRSKQLTSLPDLSKAQNLERLELSYCESLLAIPDCSDLKSLTYLSLSDCLKLTMLPQLPHNLQWLRSCKTPIEELPSSIEVLSRLVFLDLRHCSKLKCLPTNVCKWKSLENLNLKGCSKLDKFPDDIGTLNSLETLETSGTVIRELPSSITCSCLENLEYLSFGRIMGQDTIGCILPLLSHNLIDLCLKNCDITEVPDNLFSCLSSLRKLNLKGNNFESIPSSIINLSDLEILDISNCKRLKVLPELPLIAIRASNCSSLEGLSCFAFQESNILLTDDLSIEVKLNNCFKLDRSLLECIMKDALRKIQRLATSVIKHYIDKDVETLPRSTAELFYPGNEIPKWFDIQCTGSVIHAELQPDWFNHNFVGFALCAVVAFEGHPDADGYKDDINIRCQCFLKSKDGNDSGVLRGLFGFWDVYINQPTHVFMGLDFQLYPCESLYYDNEVVFKFSLEKYFDPIEDVKVEKCGVRLMYRSVPLPHKKQTFDESMLSAQTIFHLRPLSNLGHREEEDHDAVKRRAVSARSGRVEDAGGQETGTTT
ncbi:hypothetical protein EZV62_003383 [Acer yangbiense]|uniref:C-JID domain-containing protein n=1 Tax=Acer yangbiense TaxID=1000413 RepID=A0A5C7IH94_9ROSI|nr:hypothetical protein EZV62_003383 [Acer yangbiense]